MKALISYILWQGAFDFVWNSRKTLFGVQQILMKPGILNTHTAFSSLLFEQ